MFHPKECTLCGDVGFPEDLLLCNTCGVRFQHTYCSRYYPNLVFDSCEWCLYDQQRMTNINNRNLTEDTGNLTAFEFLLQIAQSIPDQCIRGENDESKSCKKEKPVVNYGRENINAEVPSSDGRGKEQFELVLQHRLDGRELHRNCKQESTSTCSAGQWPKKRSADINQTTNKKRGRSAADRWEHLGGNKLNCIKMSTSKAAIGRRYKLLADVLC